MRFRKFLKPYKTRGSSFREHTKQKVGGEFALMAMGYNLSKACNMFSFEELIVLVSA